MDLDRPAALLTDAQREYLRGEKEFKRPVHERNLRSRIRERLVAATHDLTLLYNELDPEDRKMVYSVTGYDLADRVDDELERDPELVGAIRSSIAFFYEAAHDSGRDAESIVETAVGQVEQRRNSSTIVDVNLEVEKSRLDYLADRGRSKMEQMDDLSNAEVRALLEAETEEIDPDDVSMYLRNKWEWSIHSDEQTDDFDDTDTGK
ncbi:hypothetical protein [Natrialba sp. SSL1]|uniref:hypothetical protein n=1 Tax=Natrialba sp. SSL1 TaxID=1869245 RepID=UPI0011141D7E|nr:hypothetical protein [Natrialba sp. SSL1]